MLFNEYTDILETGEVFFLDEENLYQLMMEEEKPKPETPANGLNSNDQTATPDEKPNNNNTNNSNNQGNSKEGKTLFEFFKAQQQHLSKWGSEQRTKVSDRIKNYMDQINKIPQDYNGEEEVEMPTKGVDSAPRMDHSGDNDPNKLQQCLNTFKEKVQAYKDKNDKQSKFKTVVKGASSVVGAKWLIKQLTKVSADLDINLKEGTFRVGLGSRASQKAASGDGFAMSLGHVIKNVFLAVLVLIGGIFKIIKEYLTALAKILGAIFKTVGQAGSTLVTGKMPSKN